MKKVKEFKALNNQERLLIKKCFEDNFFDLSSKEQKYFYDYIQGSLEADHEQTEKTIIKYLESDLAKQDNLNHYKDMVFKLNKDENLLMVSDMDRSKELVNIINSLKG